MIDILKDRRIFYRLLLLAFITTPLFGILGGTPFLTFNFNEFSNFLPGIYFVATITILFWAINILLLILADTYSIFNKIFIRAGICIIIGFFLSSMLLNFFRINNPSPPIRIEVETSAPDTIAMPDLDIGKNEAAYLPVDSNFKPIALGKFNMKPLHFFFFPEMVRSTTINLIIITLCELVFLYSRKQKIESENARLRQSNLEAKNNQLKMQLHPHFLFNSLNTLRLLLKKDSSKAEDYLLKLSEILRFSTASALYDLVPVEDEVKLCLNYFQMQKVRFGDMLEVEINNPDIYLMNGMLPVYSLQLLAENAIKHNAFTNEKPLTIYIDYHATDQTITVRNKIQPKNTIETSTKTGLKNLKERYRLMSNEVPAIINTGDEFSVTVKILSPNQSNG